MEGKLAAQIIPVVSRGDLHANGNDGDLPVDERPVWFPTSDKTFDTAWNKTAAGGELLPGNGFIPGDTETLRPMELQQLILMEKEIMNFDGVEILLPVGPEKTAALPGAMTPAQPHGAVTPVLPIWKKPVFLHRLAILLLQVFICRHNLSPPRSATSPPQSAGTAPKALRYCCFAGRMDVG